MGIKTTYHTFTICLAPDLPGFFRQDPQESNQRRLYLPKCAENRFFEGPTYASKVHGASSADEDELSGDKPRQFVNLENAMGRAVMDHSGLYGVWSLAPVKRHGPQALYIDHPGKMIFCSWLSSRGSVNFIQEYAVHSIRRVGLRREVGQSGSSGY